MIAVNKVIPLWVVVAVAVIAYPMSEVNKEVQPFVSHSGEAILRPGHQISMSLLEGSQNDAEDASGGTTTAEPATTTTSSNTTTTSGSSIVKPSNSVATVLLFSMLTVVPGVFFGLC